MCLRKRACVSMQYVYCMQKVALSIHRYGAVKVLVWCFIAGDVAQHQDISVRACIIKDICAGGGP